MYNLICAGSFLIILLLSNALKKTKKNELLLRTTSLILFIYKTLYYIMQNIKGNVSIPVEISSISYFLMTAIFLFRIEKIYNVGAFFGILAGLGYFFFYIFFGFTVTDVISVKELLIGCFSHGYLLICGIYLFTNYKFDRRSKLLIWITILGMLCWALVFYDIEMRGITFIYYIIKPEFLSISENMSINAVLTILYYTILVSLFCAALKLFYYINNRRYLDKKETISIRG